MTVSVIFKQGITAVFEYDINKTYKIKSRQNFINNIVSDIFRLCKPSSGWIHNCGMNYVLDVNI